MIHTQFIPNLKSCLSIQGPKLQSYLFKKYGFEQVADKYIYRELKQLKLVPKLTFSMFCHWVQG